MNNIDLTRVYEGFSIEAHHLDHPDLFFKHVHSIQVGEYGIPALYTGCSCSDDHLLSCALQLYTGSGDHGLQILGVVTAGKSNTDQTVRRLTNLKGI